MKRKNKMRGKIGHCIIIFVFACIILLSLFFTASLSHAKYYKVYVKRIDQDIYRDKDSGAYIQTRYCYEYSYGEDAILKYDDYSYDNKLIFEDGNSCNVVKVFK